MSMKLRELIRSVRACKTAAEERAVIAKESAHIRTSFKEKDNPYSHRNVAKLLYIHMLGYSTHFGQMESLKLIAGGNFSEKRIGYLGLMLLLDENQEVLMLVTNTLKSDLYHKNPYIIGLALCSLGNICSPDMARDLSPEVTKFFRHQNAYIRKKAALCATRIIRKVPEMIEDYVDPVQQALNDKNHAVLLTAVALLIEMMKIDEALIPTFRKLTSTIVRLLKNLVLAGYVSEYDVVGITDPFLQAKLIQLLRVIGSGDRDASEQMNDILAQVAINTEPTKNPGNAILYECVLTIMSIEAEAGLRVLAINILGRFLTNRDNNIRYVALNTLCRVVHRDTQAIQRHRNTVVECLKDADISIRRRALDLIYALVTKSNVKALVKELLVYLQVASADIEFRSDLTEKICSVVDKYAPSKHWQIDTIIEVLACAGNYTRETVVTDLIMLISRTPQLQAYAAFKLYNAIKKKEKSAQLPLVHVVVWCVGEFADLLVTTDGLEKARAIDDSAGSEVATEESIVQMLINVVRIPNAQLLTREYALTAMVKVCGRFHDAAQIAKLRAEMQTFSDSMAIELQQRACEYAVLSGNELASIRGGVVGRMPMPSLKKKKEKEKTDEQKTPAPSTESSNGSKKVIKPKAPEEDDDDDEDEDDDDEDEDDDDDDTAEDEETKRKAIEIPKSNGVVKKAVVPAPAQNLLDLDIFGSVPPATTSAQRSVSPMPGPASAPIFDFFADAPAPAAASASSLAVPGSSQPAAAAPSSSAVEVFNSNGLVVTFAFTRDASTPHVVNVTAAYSNTTANDFTAFDFQVAVPKTVVLVMSPASSTVIPAHSNGRVTQTFVLTNSQHGKKKLQIRVKIDYNNGAPVSEVATIAKFPE